MDWWYLAGPMTNLPQFNFPAFDRAAAKLRDADYNIISPAELDNYEARTEALASIDGAPQDGALAWHKLLRRDLSLVIKEECVGAICLPGWHKSKGALLETFVIERLGGRLFLYIEDENSGFTLRRFDRDDELERLNAVR